MISFFCEKTLKPTTVGSYYCSCLVGYENVDSTHLGTPLDGTSCQNVDECTTGDNECDANAHCTDNDGSYTCECLGGWTGDGRSCMDFEECKDMMERGVSHTGNEWIDGNTYGARGLTLMSNYTFEDCDQYAYCQGDENGVYSCHCLPGLTGDGFSCRDLDECGLTNDDPVTAVCDENATCVNTFGTYECQCNEGYSGNGKAKVFTRPDRTFSKIFNNLAIRISYYLFTDTHSVLKFEA